LKVLQDTPAIAGSAGSCPAVPFLVHRLYPNVTVSFVTDAAGNW
jgi:hypothetical protein